MFKVSVNAKIKTGPVTSVTNVVKHFMVLNAYLS